MLSICCPFYSSCFFSIRWWHDKLVVPFSWRVPVLDVWWPILHSEGIEKKKLLEKKSYLPGKLCIVGNKLLSTLGSLWCKTYKGWVLSPLTPRRDQNETSPYKILTLSNKQVMRMFKLIRYKLLSWTNIKFL